MKIRLGFVSNSSSSSYVCQVTGEARSGWDAVPEDLDMSECDNGHVFCNKFLIEDVTLQSTQETTLQHLRDNLDRYSLHNGEEYSGWKAKALETTKERIAWVEHYGEKGEAQQFLTDFRSYVENEQESYMEFNTPSAMCPICTLQHVRDQDLLNYVLAQTGLKREDVIKTIQQKHTSLKILIDAIKTRQDSETKQPPGFTLERS